jgi:hypothetical protein
MQEKLLKVAGYWAMGLILVVATLIVIRWAADFVSWSGLDSGWAQAIGGMAAIGAAYVFGERQANAALIAVRAADRVLVERRNASILAVVDACSAYCIHVKKAFGPDKVHSIYLHIQYVPKTMESHIAALEAIPAHELGSYVAVSALMGLRQSLHFFHGNVERARKMIHESIEEQGGSSAVLFDFNGKGIDICLDKNEECVNALHGALAPCRDSSVPTTDVEATPADE